MKNICFLNTTSFWGGGEKPHLEYALHFSEKNYNVYIAASKDSPLAKRAHEKNIKLFEIKLNNLSFLNIFKHIKLYRFLKREKIDTIIVTTSQDVKAAGITAKFANIERIVYMRGLAVSVKNSFINRMLFNNILTHIIANSLETKKTMVENLNRHKNIDDKVKVIYHGIELGLFDKQAKEKFPYSEEHKLVIGTAGRLTLQKRQSDLIKIAYNLKEKGLKFKMLIAGTGDLKPEIERMIEDYKLQQEVVLLDFVENIPSFMRSIDIFALTSSWEGFGYVLVEAMAASRPVVAYNISSNPEVIRDTETGFLVDYPNIDMFGEKLEQLITNSSERIQFGKNARKLVESNFQIDDKVTELENYLLDKNEA